MSELEFERLLNEVRAALTCPPSAAANEQFPIVDAANDNGLAWPLIPFPEGWYAAC